MKFERKRKEKRKRVGAKREKGDALVIKTEQSKYSDLLKAMRSDAKLVDLEPNMSSIRRTRTSEMIPEIKRNKERKGVPTFFFGEGVEVMAFTAEATLKVKNLDEVTKAEALVTALRQ